jgi:hypothetical protein
METKAIQRKVTSQTVQRRSRNQAILNQISQMPKFSLEQALNATLAAIKMETNDKVTATRKKAAAQAAVAIVTNSRFQDLAKKQDKALEFDSLVQKMLGQA